MPSSGPINKIGIYVDVAYIYNNGGQKMQYDALREFACRDYSEPVRMNAYVSYDRDRADWDETYRKGTQNFHSALRDMGYKVIVKEIQWFQDESGNRYGKANADLDLAVDVLKYFTSAESQTALSIANGTIPTLLDWETGKAVIAIDHFARQAALGAPLPSTPYMSGLWDPVTALLEALWAGADPEQALQAAQEQALKNVAELKK